MTDSVSIKKAVSTLVAGYRKEIAAAAKDEILSKTEEKKLTPWAKKHIDELRDEVVRVSVDAAVKHLRPIINRAACAIAGDDGKISADDVAKLRVPELRARASALFDGGKPSGARAALDAAVKATEFDSITDYGKSFGVEKYPASMNAKQVISKMVELDLEYVDDNYSFSSGRAAIGSFADTIRKAGKDHAESEEDAATAAKITAAYDGIGAAAERFFRSADFKKVTYASHSIAEDGDVAYDILLGQKKDGSWVTLAYSDFPF